MTPDPEKKASGKKASTSRRSNGKKAAAAAAAGAGVGLAAAAGAVAVHRYGGRTHPDGTHPFGFTPDRVETVITTDGVPLHVEVNEPKGSTTKGRPTVVLAHGFTLNLTSWCFQRRALVDAGYRVVLYDQRSHGVSESGDREHTSIDQLGKDLRSVISTVAPEGPLVLVGHSMGGMTIMSLAGQYPDLVERRVKGVALIATSAGGVGLVSVGFGKILDLFVVRFGPSLLVNLSSRRRLWRGMRRVGREVEMRATQSYGFGTPVSKELLAYTSDVIFSTPLDTIASFLPHLDELDVREALVGLSNTSVVVVNGTVDELTPASHSEDIVARLPHAEHVVIPGAGHMLPLERPTVVNAEVLGLIERGLKTPGASRGPRSRPKASAWRRSACPTPTRPGLPGPGWARCCVRVTSCSSPGTSARARRRSPRAWPKGSG